MIGYNSQIILYPGTVSEKGSRQSNARQDVITLGELIEFLKSPEANSSGGVLSVPGNIGNAASESQLPYLIAMAAAGFDMSRISIEEGSAMPDNVKLNSCRFSGAKMPGVIISATVLSDLDDIDLSESNLAGAQLTNVSLIGSVLRSADLSGAVLIGCEINDSDLSFAVLDGATFETCDFGGSDLTGASLANIVIGAAGGVSLVDCNLSNVVITGTTIDLAKINMTGVSAEGLIATDVSFINALVSGLSLNNCDFSGCTFTGSGLVSSSLFKCSFLDAVFDTSSSVAGTSFETCDFSGATFTFISIQDASFLGCNFDGKGIEEVFSADNMDGLSIGDQVTWTDGIVYEWTAGGWLSL